MSAVDLSLLAEPFPVGELQWRLMRAGKNDRGLWGICVPYIESRSVRRRLNDVCGPANWQSATQLGAGHISVGIGILIDGEWVWRWDGAGVMEGGHLSAADAGKGDFTNGFKRAGIQWAIGEYLSDVPELFALINPGGRFRGKTKDGERFKWDPPELPASALPNTEPPIVSEVRELIQKAANLGLGGDDEKDARGIEAAEKAISQHDTDSLQRAKTWLEGEVEKREKAELEKAEKELGGQSQPDPEPAEAGLPF